MKTGLRNSQGGFLIRGNERGQDEEVSREREAEGREKREEKKLHKMTECEIKTVEMRK